MIRQIALFALSLLAVSFLFGCKKDAPDAARTSGGVRTESRAGADDQWGPNCRAYFAAVAEACKPPHDQGSACKSWTTGVQSMKERPKDDPKNAEAEKVGCKMMIGMVQRAIAERR